MSDRPKVIKSRCIPVLFCTDSVLGGSDASGAQMSSGRESNQGIDLPAGMTISSLENSTNSSSSWQERARDFLLELSGVKDEMASRICNSGLSPNLPHLLADPSR